MLALQEAHCTPHLALRPILMCMPCVLGCRTPHSTLASACRSCCTVCHTPPHHILTHHARGRMTLSIFDVFNAKDTQLEVFQLCLNAWLLLLNLAPCPVSCVHALHVGLSCASQTLASARRLCRTACHTPLHTS